MRPVVVHVERDEAEHGDVERDVPTRVRAAERVLRRIQPSALNP